MTLRASGTTTVYAAAHSLGPALPRVAAGIAVAVEEWRRRGVEGWDEGWLERGVTVGDRLGRVALGATPGQVVVGDSTSVNIYKLASAALDARPDRRAIVVAADEFPTDRYVLEGLAAARGLEIRREVDGDTALVCRSLVDFRTCALADLDGLVAAAHDVGALALVDLSHAVGIVPVELDASGVDLAVGCTYKWLAAGPGAPAFLYVRRDLQELQQPIWGWFGQRDQFVMGPAYDPYDDVRRFQAGTPPIIGLAAVDAAVGVIEEAGGIDGVRAESLNLTDDFVDMLGGRFEVVTPEEHGGHIAVRTSVTVQQLRERGVICDGRGDLLRFGFHPLTSGADDLFTAASALLASG